VTHGKQAGLHQSQKLLTDSINRGQIEIFLRSRASTGYRLGPTNNLPHKRSNSDYNRSTDARTAPHRANCRGIRVQRILSTGQLRLFRRRLELVWRPIETACPRQRWLDGLAVEARKVSPSIAELPHPCHAPHWFPIVFVLTGSIVAVPGFRLSGPGDSWCFFFLCKHNLPTCNFFKGIIRADT